MSLDFIAGWYGLAAPSARLSRATLLALLADDLVGTCLLVCFCLGLVAFVWGWLLLFGVGC
jgi:hypothetical protein